MTHSDYRWPLSDKGWFKPLKAACARLPRNQVTREQALAVLAKLPPPLNSPCRFVAGMIRDVRATTQGELHAAFAGPEGALGGAERSLVHALLPDAFDADALAREQVATFDGPRFHLAPLETFDLMLHAGERFLTHWVMNPWHPLQDFVDYWASTLPHVEAQALDALMPGRRATRREQTLAWMQLLHCFRNPRGPQGQDSAASRLRDRLVAVLEQGAAGNPTLAALWQHAKSPQGRAPQAAVHRLPARVLHACTREAWKEQSGDSVAIVKPVARFDRPTTPTWSAMREVVDAYRALGFTDEIFDPARIDLVDVGDLTCSEFARFHWNYWSPQREAHYASDCDVVAYRYRLDLGSRLSICDNDEIRVELQLLHMVSDGGQSPSYELLVVPYLHLAPGLAGCDLHTVLCERQVVGHLFRERRLALVRAEHRSDCYALAGVRREGAEFFHMGRDADFIEHEAWQRPADDTIRPWNGKHRKGMSRVRPDLAHLHEMHGQRRNVDLERFRRAVMEQRAV